MRVEIIDRFSGLCQLEKCWNDLLTSSGESCIFLTFEWFSSFVKSFALEDKLAVGVMREGSEIVGILPFYRDSHSFMGIRFNVLRSISNVHTPKYGFLIKAGYERVLENALIQLLHYWAWDYISLDYVCEQTGLLKLFNQNQYKRFWVKKLFVMESPYIKILGSWDKYYNEQISRTHRKKIDYEERRAQKDYEIGFESVEGISLDQCVLGEVFDIEDSGWKGRNKSSILSNAKVRTFYEELAFKMNERGWFALHFLNMGGRRVAFEYNLNYGSRMCTLKIGYDEAFSKYSPGGILKKWSVKKAHEEGYRIYDMLGSNADYKLIWTKDTNAIYRVYILRRNLKSRWLKFVWFDIGEIGEKIGIKKSVKEILARVRKIFRSVDR